MFQSLNFIFFMFYFLDSREKKKKSLEKKITANTILFAIIYLILEIKNTKYVDLAF